jgi:two-component system, NtrC family, sensor kinase
MVHHTSSLTRRVILGTLAIAISGIVCTGAAVYYTSYKAITDLETSELTHLVETTMNMVHQVSDQAVVNTLRAVAERNREIVLHIYADYKSGKITEAEAKSIATGILLSQRIGSSGYIYCINSTAIMQVHPKRALIGSDMSAFPLSREQVSKKHGYIEYFWKNPGESMARPKALYMAYFEPWDWIISVSSYRQEFYELVNPKDFRDDLLGVRLGKSGYLYIMDGKGNLVVHPTMEGSNQANVVDAKGFRFIAEMLERKNGSIRYWWQDAGISHPREKLVVYRYNATFDWIVAGGVYTEELYQPLERVKLVVLVVLSATVVLVLLLSVLFGRRVVAAEEAAKIALRASLETTQTIIDKVPFSLILLEKDLTIRRANEAAGRSLGLDPKKLAGRNWCDFFPKRPDSSTDPLILAGRPGEGDEVDAINANGDPLSILRTVIPVVIDGKEIYIQAFLDLSERKRLESELRQAQKLEAVGQLAAGIAHEINTPAQFVGDSINFLQGAFGDQRALLEKYRQALVSLASAAGNTKIVEEFKVVEESADLAYVDENASDAFGRASDGISRISTIVGAMKEFAHPDTREKGTADLNQALKTVLIVACNEYRDVADIQTEFANLPPVLCHLGDINQVFLNLVVNAAHAIADAVRTSGKKGLIKIRTAQRGNSVRIDIEDSGTGIPVAIRSRIFDPFFTTKPVGSGTGQGLSIARSIIVEKHGGQLTFESELGKGTVFSITLPMDGLQSRAPASINRPSPSN